MEGLRIVLLCTVGAVLYGILHDQVTARICVEYFTIGHPPLVQSESPTILALAWGVAATWWVGCGMGLLLAAASRLGSMPALTAREHVRPLVCAHLPCRGEVRLAGCSAGVCRAAPRVEAHTLGSHGCPRPSPPRPDAVRTGTDPAAEHRIRGSTAPPPARTG